MKVWDVHIRVERSEAGVEFYEDMEAEYLHLKPVYSIYNAWSVTHYYAQQYMTHGFEKGRSLPWYAKFKKKISIENKIFLWKQSFWILSTIVFFSGDTEDISRYERELNIHWIVNSWNNIKGCQLKEGNNMTNVLLLEWFFTAEL